MKNHPERKRLRLQGYDYSSDGLYFVTICAKGRKYYFGEIRNGIMGLNEMGILAHQFWQDIPRHFDHVSLDEFVIMPDHVHGIIVIHSPVGARHAWPLQEKPNHQKIPVIIGSFKSAVARKIRQNHDFDFAWQRSYYDCVVRSERELDRIRRYIQSNPEKCPQERGDFSGNKKA